MTATLDTTTETQAHTWHLTADELEATRNKIAKINTRAAKRGFTGRIEVHATRRETTREVGGLQVTEIVYDTRITGDAPRYNGWTFLATLDWDPNAGLIVRTAPGIDTVNRDGLHEGWCGHCRTHRHRKATYLLRNEAGEQIQVGSTCIKDFLGWTATPVFVYADDLRDEIDGLLGDGGYCPREFTTDTVFAAAWAAIKRYGYVRANDWNGVPTKVVVGDLLDPRNKNARQLAAEMAAEIAEAAGMGAKIREFILSDDFPGDSEYVRNLKAIAAADAVSPWNLGLAVSAPQAWARHNEQTLIRQRERAEVRDEFYGTVGQRDVEVRVQVRNVSWSQNAYGTSTVYTLVSDDGYLFKWFASKDALGDEPGDTWFTLRKCWIKAHKEWNGQKETQLTRCKAIEE
ncbi:hypothetical protein [Amycolatopsis thermophila]|uniref:Uncharacterized protein n=1 Tax=Amycolatopsis thermophila TaxID=206084 RepID=A0ABU0EMS0_9PSEU|nr:hypothetical protein [Amycolatopsis thermophila]MDQ0376532.1 hypothetical protein [Amycolatopsis thermophila]